MGKREVIAVLALLTGVALLTRAATLPLGAVIVAVGAYLLALPRLSGPRSVEPRENGPGT